MKFMIISILFSMQIFANNQLITCSHPEICKVVQLILAKENIAIATKSVFSPVGDPHEYEPKVSNIKEVYKAQYFISGPNELNPWLNKISSVNLHKTNIGNEVIAYYKTNNKEALSHFWLYPEIYCSIKKQIADDLKQNLKLAINHFACDTKLIHNELKSTMSENKYPIILTHDALLPLINYYSPSTPVVAIKGSGHHEESSPQSIKKLNELLKGPKVIWIIEDSINVPNNILNKIRPNDFIIKINTANSLNEQSDFAILSLLVDKFKRLK